MFDRSQSLMNLLMFIDPTFLYVMLFLIASSWTTDVVQFRTQWSDRYGPQVQLVTSSVLPDWVVIRSMVFLEQWVGLAMCIMKPIASNISLKIPASSSEVLSLRWIFTSPITTTLLYLISLSGNQFVMSSMNILFVIGALE